VLSLEKMFHGFIQIEEIRQVFRECNYEINQTISELLEIKNKKINEMNPSMVNSISEDDHLQKLLSRFGTRVDSESVEMILRECGNNFQLACESICQIYEIFEFETLPSEVDHQQLRSAESSIEFDDLLSRYQDCVDVDIILALHEECQGNFDQIRRQLNDLIAPKVDESDSSGPITDPPTPLLDSRTLVSLIRSTLTDFLPDDAVNQFVVHNSITESLTSPTRLEFLLNQILLVISTLTSSEEENLVDSLSSSQQDSLQVIEEDALDIVLSQCDADGIPVDWTFTSLELSLDSDNAQTGDDLSLLDLLSFGNTLTESNIPSESNDLNPIDTLRQLLDQIFGSSSNHLLTDDMISSALEAHEYDFDSTIVTLSQTLNELMNADSGPVKGNSHLQQGRVKKNSGPRTKGLQREC
jgi:hypothetical protein